MEKSGIPDGGNDVRPFDLIFVSMIKTCCLADGGTHAQDRVNGSKINTQGVTSDVTGINCPGGRLFNGKKTGPVGAPGTQGRTPARNLHRLD